MGGFFGMTSKKDCIAEVFFGTDYHSHLGTNKAGMAAFDPEKGLQREIHNIENAPFRTKFEHIFEEMKGKSAIGCISDAVPQPLLIRSDLGTFAIAVVGRVNNAEDLIHRLLSFGSGHFCALEGGKINEVELIASLITRKSSFAEGIRFAQCEIEGTASVLILKEDGHLIAARDRLGRLPVHIGRGENCRCVTFESFACEKLGCEDSRELGPGEIVELSPEGEETLMGPFRKMKICSFLWSYYGYPTSTYEGVNVEVMRYRNGRILSENDGEEKRKGIDYVCGVPDSGTPHAIGYANDAHLPFARPYIKYTPSWSRSFLPSTQVDRNMVAKMKQIPVRNLIKDKNLLFVDDSIVRGTQLRETVDFLRQNGAKSVHMRSACPPIFFGCKYLNFSRFTGDMDLLTRKIIHELEGEEGVNHLDEYIDGSTDRGKKLRETICRKYHFDSLEFQTLKGISDAIGIDPCSLCTYCWNGKE